MIRRLATPIALAVAVVVFVVFFLLLPGAGVLVQVGVPAAVAAVAAIGVAFALGRTPGQIRNDQYSDDARDKVEEVHRTLGDLRQAAAKVQSRQVVQYVAQANKFVPELLARVSRTSPSSLYSSASQIGGHLLSLLGVVRQFSDIERNPQFYDDAPRVLASGEAAVRRFAEFAVESIKLVNQGEMAQYEANLATVAPPELPKLGGNA